MSCKIDHAPEIRGFLEKEYTPGDAVYFCVISDHSLRAIGCGQVATALEACFQLLQTADLDSHDLLQYAFLRKSRSFEDLVTGFKAFKERVDSVDAQKGCR